MRTYGVVGGGLMGSGIAFTIASRTKDQVVLCEVSDAAVQQARQRLEGLAARAVKKGTAQADADGWLARIQLTTSFADLAPAELIVEAVFEDMAVKQAVFRQLDAVAGPDAVLCSNTSSLSITQIASVTGRPQQVVGTHFFNPVPVMKLVEMVEGFQTDPAVTAKARSFCESLGKDVIVAKDYAGFVVTRIGQAMMCEAIRCLEEGVASPEDIDRGMRLGHNWPMGPLELMDLIGLETELRIQEFLYGEFGEVFRPSQLLKSMVRAGHLGRKTGRGFYNYEK